MIDPNLLRTETARVKMGLARKKFDCDVDGFLALDAKRRELMAQAEAKRAAQNSANQEMARMDKKSGEFVQKLAQMKALAEEVKALEATERELEASWNAALLNIPNIPDVSVPDGIGDDQNVVHSAWGNPDELVSPHAAPHWDVPGFDRWIDFPRGVKVTGAGFPFYVGAMARLVRALLQFFLDEAAKNGYTELLCPHMVNTASALGTGALPDKEAQMYVATADQLYLIPTAEVPVTNFYRDEILEEAQLPIRHCSYTPCFRREAGSWGAHVRGLNRLHQFDKVELVQWVHPSISLQALDDLWAQAAKLLQKLGLPHRVLLMCSKEIGFPHAKQYDIEVWAGGQKRWLEVSSCSNFSEFQARRANIRYRPAGGGKPTHVHTLNGSGLAIPRVLASILENNVQADGRVRIPVVLEKLFGSAYLE